MQDKILEIFKEHLSLEERELVENHLDHIMRTGIKPYFKGNNQFFWQFIAFDGKTHTINNNQYKYYLHLANDVIVGKINTIKEILKNG